MKNHRFLYAGDKKWVLAPIFDVNPFPERSRILKTPIADLSDNSMSLELLLESAFYFEIGKDEGSTIIADMAKIIRDAWIPLARKNGMNDRDILAFMPAFEHEEMDLALRMKRTTFAPRP